MSHVDAEGSLELSSETCSASATTMLRQVQTDSPSAVQDPISQTSKASGISDLVQKTASVFSLGSWWSSTKEPTDRNSSGGVAQSFIRRWDWIRHYRSQGMSFDPSLQ